MSFNIRRTSRNVGYSNMARGGNGNAKKKQKTANEDNEDNEYNEDNECNEDNEYNEDTYQSLHYSDSDEDNIGVTDPLNYNYFEEDPEKFLIDFDIDVERDRTCTSTRYNGIDAETSSSKLIGIFTSGMVNIATQNKIVDWIEEVTGYKFINSNPLDIGRYSIKIDVCSGCHNTVYAGTTNKFLFECAKCGVPRFNPCSNDQCRKTSTMCKQIAHMNRRYSTDYLIYVPIYTLICSLLSTKWWSTLIRDSQNRHNAPADDFIIDSLSASTAKRLMGEMKSQYVRSCAHLASSEIPEEVNLLISINYDGAKMFKKKVATFCPFFITFHNVLAPLKQVFGVGTFLLGSVLNLDTLAECFFLFDCILRELKELQLGKKYTCAITNRKYFVQVRLLYPIFDTKGFEKWFNVQSAGSLAGCYLDGVIYGAHVPELGKRIYVGHRVFLDDSNYTRFFTMSGLCCPVGHYTDNKMKDFNPTGLRIGNKTPGLMVAASWASCCESPFEHQTSLDSSREALKAGVFVTVHEMEFVKLMENAFYSVTADLRPQQKHKRLSQAFSKECGENAEPGRPVHGFKGPMKFHSLTYFDIAEQAVFGPEHSMAGAISKLIWMLKDDKWQWTQARQDYCEKYNVFPFFREKAKLPWALTIDEMKSIDKWLDCLCVPVGTESATKVKKLFSQTGFLNDKMLINSAVIYLPVLLAFTDIDPAYKSFIFMYCVDIGHMLKLSFTSAEAVHLQNKMIETLSIMEMMFLPVMNDMVVHELVDIIGFIPSGGCIRDFWEFGGERMNGIVKRYMKQYGGQKLLHGAVQEYLKAEQVASETTLNMDCEIIDFIACLSTSHRGVALGKLSWNDESQKFWFDSTKRFFKDKLVYDSGSIRGFSDSEIICLFNIVGFRNKRDKREDGPMSKLYEAFNKKAKVKPGQKEISLVQFIQTLFLQCPELTDLNSFVEQLLSCRITAYSTMVHKEVEIKSFGEHLLKPSQSAYELKKTYSNAKSRSSWISHSTYDRDISIHGAVKASSSNFAIQKRTYAQVRSYFCFPREVVVLEPALAGYFAFLCPYESEWTPILSSADHFYSNTVARNGLVSPENGKYVAAAAGVHKIFTTSRASENLDDQTIVPVEMIYSSGVGLFPLAQEDPSKIALSPVSFGKPADVLIMVDLHPWNFH